MPGENQEPLESRPEFREWVDQEPLPSWGRMPLTHVTKTFVAADIIRDGAIGTKYCDNLKDNLAFMFYGRPAYRVSGDGAIKRTGSSPFCFIFKPSLIESAKAIYAFDTGAFARRLYKQFLLDEMGIEDFCLELDLERPNKLISRVFDAQDRYYDGLPSHSKLGEVLKEWDFLAAAYVDLLSSRGRNEPDDRVASIEVVFSQPISISQSLEAVVVPHTIWNDAEQVIWLKDLNERGVKILTYVFYPSRDAEFSRALLEIEVRKYIFG